MKPYTAYIICLDENKRIPELESIIITSPEYSYRYALFIIKGRWLEAESIILTSPEYAYRYALNIIKRHWPEAGSIILTDPGYSYYYALDVIKQRWPKVEPKIRQNNFYWDLYCFHFNIKKNKCNWKVGL